MRKRKAQKQPEPGSLAPARVTRPPTGGLAQAMDAASEFRPGHVPPHATLLVAWVKLPGENEQRTGHWAKQKAWKDQLQKDFGACLELQGHPGTYANPAVHIAMHVSRKGDDNNQLSRAKYVIDVLQVKKVRSDGQRVQGLLDLIENDDVLNAENRTTEERFIPVRKTESLDRYKRVIRLADYKVMVWVWDRAC